MANLVWIIPFVVLAVIFAVAGSRDMVGFLRIGPGRSNRYRTGFILVLWLAGVGGIWYLQDGPWLAALANAFFWTKIVGFSLGLFVLVSWLSSLRRRGPGRVWAMAWTTFREAMSQRAWLAVPLWLVGVLVVGMFISPYRLVQDRMMLATQLLVRGQLLVVGLLILTLACRSIPRELERKTIMVTASKPISLLELVWGKLLGFLLLAGMLVAAMGVLSYAVLWYHGQQVRRQARLELASQQEQYRQGQRQLLPDSDLQEIVDAGVLYARDAVYPSGPPGFNGKYDPLLNQRPCLKGGSGASIQWRFDDIPVTDREPTLALRFVVERVPEEISQSEDSKAIEGLRIKVQGISARLPRRSRVEEEWELPVPPDRRLFFPTGRVFRLAQEKWDVLYNRGPVVIDLKLPGRGHYLYFSPASAELMNLSPERAELEREGRRKLPPEEGRGVVVAHKFRNAYEISGVEAGEPEVAYWRFKNVQLSKFGPGEQIRFEIQSYREKSDVVKSYTVGLVRAMAIKPDGQREFWPTGKELEPLAEEKLLERAWPGWKQIVIQEKRPSWVNLPRRLFSKDADVYVFLACGSPKEWLAIGKKSGYLARGGRSFAANVARCEAIVFLQVSAIAAVAVMASSFLSWPVACFLSMVIYLMGTARPYMQEMAKFWGQAAESLSSYTMGALGRILPNFALYQATQYISEGEIISGEKLADLFNQTSLSVVGLVVMAYLFLRCRELAK